MTTAILFAAALTSAFAPPAEWTAYLRRVGPIRVGMTAAQAHEALRDSSRERKPAGDPGGCAYLTSGALPHGVGVMLDGESVVRVDISSPAIKTASGVGVGDTEDRIARAYPGRITTTPHKYETKGHYLTYVARDPLDRDMGMVFETDGRRVTSFRVGTVAAIGLVERCG